MTEPTTASARWYHGVTRYQWLVLIVASLGWVFDAFEGQLFNITRADMLQDILHVTANDPQIQFYGDAFLGVFLVGGTLGGLLFGSLGDRWGRSPVMIVTILMYSAFSGLTYLATELWHVAVLRFLVAMGVGGEWSVAAALVAEVFPQKARTHASGIFHATSMLGLWLAGFTGMWVGAEWRTAYLIGILPALLTLWVRASVRETPRRVVTETTTTRGSFRELLGDRRWRGRALLGMGLATVGLATFWGVTIAGQDLAKSILLRNAVEPAIASQKAKFAFSIVQNIGAGLGMLSFGPLSVRWGRRRTFAVMLIGSSVFVPIVCYVPQTYGQALLLLPVLGFLTLSIHAGFAIYFPELFPSHLRATGTGFCFNAGRLVAAPVLWISGQLKAAYDLRFAVSLLGSLFLVGLIFVRYLPETSGQDLPE